MSSLAWLIMVALLAITATGAIRHRSREIDTDTIELTPPDQRPLSDEEKKARGYRAKAAMDEFLAPAINLIAAEYLLALTTIAANEPWATSKITNLAVAQKAIKMAEQHVIGVIMDGEVASQNLERAKKIAALPEAKRRWVA